MNIIIIPLLSALSPRNLQINICFHLTIIFTNVIVKNFHLNLRKMLQASLVLTKIPKGPMSGTSISKWSETQNSILH